MRQTETFRVWRGERMNGECRRGKTERPIGMGLETVERQQGAKGHRVETTCQGGEDEGRTEYTLYLRAH